MRRRFLAVLVLIGIVMTGSMSWGQTVRHDPVEDEYNTADLFFVRPAAVGAGILGTGLFILSLPFTIPTGGVEASAQMFMVRPFRFALERPFPDDSILSGDVLINYR